MRKVVLCIGIGLSLIFCLSDTQAQYRWTDLSGPYWVNGIDVAISGFSTLERSRFLIGTDNSEMNVFAWNSTERKWDYPNPTSSSAKRLISYKDNSVARVFWAFCALYDGPTLWTRNNGNSWATELSAPNDRYTSIEVINDERVDPPEGPVTLFVGCEPDGNLATAYYSIDAGNNWDRLGGPPDGQDPDPFYGVRVYDIETMQSSKILAGTENGIYRHSLPDYGSNWGEPVAFTGQHVPVLETGDGHAPAEIAAVIDGETWKLYFSVSGDGGYEEITHDGQSFDKEVCDLAAVATRSQRFSCYAATSQGLYLLDFSIEDPSDCNIIDLKEGSSTSGFHPMKYDQDIEAVDLFLMAGTPPLVNDSIYVLAATPFNIYEIIEVRDVNNNLVDLTMSDAVTGTYLSNSVAVALPGYTISPKTVFTESVNGLVKEQDEMNKDWNFVGKAFAEDSPSRIGTDIATDFEGGTDYILAPSYQATEGTVMRSTSGGAFWQNNSPINDPVIQAVSLDPNSEYAYAAGAGDRIWWWTETNGHWTASNTSFTNPDFHDVIPDPDGEQGGNVYACGSGNAKVVMSTDHGDYWSPFENGLGSVTDVNQLAKGGAVNWLYAATNLGVYKIDIGAATPTWMPRTYGIGSPNLGSIVVDKHDPYALLVATSPEAASPHIWASGDSGRSWIELPLGDIPSENCHINRLAASEDANGGFVVGTDLGVFYIGDIFKRGDVSGPPEDHTVTWGPGIVIVNGDIAVREGTRLRIEHPCTVYFTYNFDASGAGSDPNRIELHMLSNAKLEAVGTSSEHIVFTSSKPAGKAAGDWHGITPYVSTEVDLEYCDIQYAVKGIEDVNFTWSLARLIVSHCTFSDMQMAGIDLYQSALLEDVQIESSIFTNCGSYGIRVRHDEDTSSKTMTISQNEISGCGYGIWYSGNASTGDSKRLNLYDNIISRAVPSGYYGIHVQRSLSQGFSPIVDVLSDSVIYFAQGGIRLINVSGTSTLMKNKVKRNGVYGLRLEGSSPTIGSSSQQSNNAFSFNQYGISCDKGSNPVVRGTKIKENTGGGVQIEARSGPAAPNFGIGPDFGNNSINTQVPIPPGYYDMRNYSPSVIVMAEGNWWGGLTDFGPIIGFIDYTPSLPSDPLPGNEKRDSGIAASPSAVTLDQNFPNPFNPTTEISFALKEAGFVSLRVYSITGQLVKTITSGEFESGEHSVIWDGRNSEGRDVSSGIYFCVLSTDNGRASRSMTLLR